MPAGTFLPPGLTTSDVKITSGGTDNYVMTAVDGETIQGEANLTFDGSDLFLANTIGMVVGHTAQVTTTDVREFQVLGTDSADSGALFARFQAAAGGPVLQFLKSRDPAIADGTFAIVSDNDTIGSLDFHPDDGNDFATRAAQFIARVDDGSPEENFVGMEFVWKQMPGGDSINSGALIETMSIGANGMMTYGGGIARDTGIIFDNAGTDYHIGIDQTADALVIGEGTTLGAAGTEFIVITDANSAHSVYIKPTKTALVDTGANLAIGGNLTAAVGASISLFRVGGTIIEAGSGTHPLLVGSNFVAPTITGAGAATTTGATVYISGAPATATNQYALFVDDGASRFDGDVELHNTATTISSGNDIGLIEWNTHDDSTQGEGAVASMRAEAASNYTGARAADLVFSTAHSAGSVFTPIDRMRIGSRAGTDGGIVTISDAATSVTKNTKMTTGLTINQGVADDEILAFKSSDVGHGMTTKAETDTYAAFKKVHITGGGLSIETYQDVAADTIPSLQVIAAAAQADDTHDSPSSWGVIQFDARLKDGTGTGPMAGDDNIFVVKNNTNTMFIVDGEGDLFANGSAATVYDGFDDAHLVRALDIAKNSKDLIRDDWDSFLKYGEDKLVELGILGAKIDDGGLINVTGLQRLHNGAIWQGYVRQQEMQERINTLESRLLAIEGA